MTMATGPNADALVTAVEVEAGLDSGCLGYAYGASGAWWFRVTDEGIEHAPSASADPTPYEIVAFDGSSVVRWRRSAGDWGVRRVTGVRPDGLKVRTLLAGHVDAADGGWATLVGRRGTRFDVPLSAVGGQAVVLEQVEEVAVDSYGNARVVATQPVRLTAADDPAEVK